MIHDSRIRMIPGVPKTKSPSNAIPGIIFEYAMPMANAGMTNRKPASGPAIPTSNSCRFVGIADRMRMKAPKVPISVGAGRKYGRLASIP